MRMKKNEFQALKERNMSMNEYLTRFNQLAHYALRDVADKEEKIDCFVEGMHEEMRVQLIIQDHLSFHHLVNKALILENERRMMEASRKQKMAAQRQQGSYSQRSVHQGNPSFRQITAPPPKAPVSALRPSGNVLRTPQPSRQSATTNPAVHLHCFSCGEKGHFTNHA